MLLTEEQMLLVNQLREEISKREYELSRLLEKFETLKYLEAVNKAEYDRIMDNWDTYREMIAKGDRTSLPREWFETVIEHCYYIGFEAGVKKTFDEYLVKSEPEPVAWMVENHPASDTFVNFTSNFNSHFEKLGCKVTPLYTVLPDQ